MTNVSVGILTDKAIRTLVKGQPPLIKDFVDRLVQPCSYDLRIGTIFDRRIINAKSSETHIVLEPGDIISVFTLEEVNLPADVAATVYPPNSVSLHGLLVLNPGHVDPGFSGPLTVKIVNISSVPKTIARGDIIFTIIFERLPEIVDNPYAKSKPRDLRELEFLSLDVQQNPRSIGRMLERGRPAPVVTPEQVRKIVLEHWVTSVVFITSFVAAVASVIAVIQGFKKN